MTRHVSPISCFIHLVNLTPHPINLLGSDGTETVISPEKVVARVIFDETKVEKICIQGAQIAVVRPSVQSVVDLPPQQKGVGLIVSRLVADIVRRDDLLVPHNLVRGDSGEVVGCRSFACS